MRRRPKLGQHFLSSPRYRERIARALPLRPENLVIEIGAGKGAITELLGQRAGRVVAIELDESLARQLRDRFLDRLPIEVLNADILATDIGRLCRRAERDSCYVFGNLPYAITSPILHHLFHFRTWIRGMALVVQNEVAERLTASPGTSAYGYLSVLAQAFSQPRIAFRVPPGAFHPPPEVHSALVVFRMVSGLPAEVCAAQEEFLEFVKRSFAQKRKQLAKNLAAFYPRERLQSEFARLGLAPTLRAEQIPVETFAQLLLRLLAPRPGKDQGAGLLGEAFSSRRQENGPS